MKTKKVKLFQKLVMATIVASFIGAQASAFADCASDENKCTTDAGNIYNDQIAADESQLGWQSLSCLLLVIPDLIAHCQADAELTFTDQVNDAIAAHNNTVDQCQKLYQQCIKKQQA